MKKHILERYLQDSDGRFVIDITAGKVGDLYTDFDKHAPYVKKDLDENLVNYIAEAVRDLGKAEFIIQFRFMTMPDDSLLERIRGSVYNYFLYLKEIELRELMRNIRISLIFLIVGLAILFLSVWINQQVTDQSSVVTRVFAEGLTIAAWVSLWEALATFLVNWTPYSRQIRMYDRIARAPIQFSTT